MSAEDRRFFKGCVLDRARVSDPEQKVLDELASAFPD
jgi:hypothetical protein